MFLMLLACVADRAAGQSIIRDINGPETPEPKSVWMPFAFYSDATGFSLGVGGATTGTYQPQLFFGAATFVSANGSTGFYFMNDNLRLGDSRFFLDSMIGITRFADTQEYVDGNPNFPNEQAGSNNSSPDDFVDSETYTVSGEFPLKYVLPIGSGRSDPIAHYVTEHGMFKEGAQGGDAFNPFTSGRTYLILTPFVMNRELHTDTPVAQTTYNTNGVRLAMEWLNVDFPLNPSRGNIAKIQLSRDFGMLKSSEQYTTLEAAYSQFIPLGRSKAFKQQVLALHGWTIATTAGETPYFTGATLGGYERMRGYNFNRFHGNSALMGSAEFRLIPDWNPIADLKDVNRLAQVEWIQFVIFGEAGRVADSYSSELLKDLQWDAGFGIRALSRMVVLRADFAFDDEGWMFWVMVGQSF